jgi:hypothetical protein
MRALCVRLCVCVCLCVYVCLCVCVCVCVTALVRRPNEPTKCRRKHISRTQQGPTHTHHPSSTQTQVHACTCTRTKSMTDLRPRGWGVRRSRAASPRVVVARIHRAVPHWRAAAGGRAAPAALPSLILTVALRQRRLERRAHRVHHVRDRAKTVRSVVRSGVLRRRRRRRATNDRARADRRREWHVERRRRAAAMHVDCSTGGVLRKSQRPAAAAAAAAAAVATHRRGQLLLHTHRGRWCRWCGGNITPNNTVHTPLSLSCCHCVLPQTTPTHHEIRDGSCDSCHETLTDHDLAATAFFWWRAQGGTQARGAPQTEAAGTAAADPC